LIWILLVYGMIGAVLIAAVIQKSRRQMRHIASGLLVSYITISIILGAAEIYFHFFYADTMGYCFTLSCLNWNSRYWHLNSLGYRDREISPTEWEGKTTVLVVGDSFTAGLGIEQPEDRYGDVLGARLGQEYVVANVGEIGVATPDELTNLQTYPLQNPDVVIWQYFLNDVEHAALSLGYQPGLAIIPPQGIVNESYLLNFAYWRFYLGTNSQNMGRTHWDWNYAQYDNYVVWDIHRAELEAVIDYVDSIGARLIVVIFPNMSEPYQSIAYVDRVAQVFYDNGENEVLKLFDVAEAFSIEERLVSAYDPHPSASFNRYVGELLYEQFFERNSDE
jgi:hypothetical protein